MDQRHKGSLRSCSIAVDDGRIDGGCGGGLHFHLHLHFGLCVCRVGRLMVGQMLVQYLTV